jgi:hypothetical protein
MTEKHTLNRTVKTKRYSPNFGEVFFIWLFYGIFRMAFYRYLWPWSFFGIVLNYILLFSAISLTFRAIFSPRYIYSVDEKTEMPSTTHKIPSESMNTSSDNYINTEKGGTKQETPTDTPPKTKIELKESTPNPTRKIIYCSFCGVENVAEANFCHACGEKLR